MIQGSRCMMSATEQEAQDTRQECSAVGDVDMDSQLSDPPDSQVTVAMDEGDCSGGEELKPHPGDSGTRKAIEHPLTEQGEEKAPDADLSSVRAEPEANQAVDSVDGQRQESSAVTEKQQIQSEESMASQSNSSGDEDSGSGSGQPQPKPTFPTTLTEFGYHFNKDGQLRSIKTDEPFVFEVKKEDQKYNQAHYEALGEVITEEVYRLLETEAHLEKVYVPLKQKKDEPRSFIFTSADATTNPDKLMLLIHGSGVVRAGQWARSLIINDCLKSGTQLPYIKQAMSEGYGVIVFNTNYNQVEPGGPLIRKNGSPKEHAQYVWKHLVKNAKAKKIYIVAHSFGGVVTVDLMAAKFDEFKNRVHKIAFTDSVHIFTHKKAVNWVSSDQPLDEEVDSHPGEVKRLSAGTQRHVETSWYAFESIFKFFNEKLIE